MSRRAYPAVETDGGEPTESRYSVVRSIRVGTNDQTEHVVILTYGLRAVLLAAKRISQNRRRRRAARAGKSMRGRGPSSPRNGTPSNQRFSRDTSGASARKRSCPITLSA